MATQMESNQFVSQGLQAPAPGVRVDDGANPLSAARSSFPAADLCLAGLRSVPEIPRAQSVSSILAGNPRGTAAFGDCRAFAADPAGRNSLGERRVRPALNWARDDARHAARTGAQVTRLLRGCGASTRRQPSRSARQPRRGPHTIIRSVSCRPAAVGGAAPRSSACAVVSAIKANVTRVVQTHTARIMGVLPWRCCVVATYNCAPRLRQVPNHRFAPARPARGAGYVSTPTIAPIRQVASVPDTIDFSPSETTSSRRSGAMVASPAIMMPSEPKLAKPHMA